MTRPTKPRDWAVEVLTKVASQHSYSNLALDATLRAAELSPRDTALVTNIVYGVIQHDLTLDYWLAPFIKGKQLAEWVLVVLKTALYQMQYLDKVPNRAIFYDATEIAKRRGHEGIAKLVTAVLRNIERQGVADLTAIADRTERLSITYSVPTWLVARLTAELGEVKTQAILAVIDQPAQASLRVNTTKLSRDALLSELRDRVPDIAPSALTPFGLVAPGGHLAGLPEFVVGDYTMQDESSMLVAPSLALKPGDQVLDACAAPGGKTTHIAQYLDPAQGGHVTALDLHDNKVRLITQNAKRLGLADRVEAYALDARQAGDQFAPQSFDAVLVDAPCSGLGLIRRKPEIRYEKSPADITHLHGTQLAILNGVADLVKIGGRLTYSTCTMIREENQDVVASFLTAHPDFTQVAVPVAAPVDHAHGAPCLQIFPDDYGTDGFFIASFVRTTSSAAKGE